MKKIFLIALFYIVFTTLSLIVIQDNRQHFYLLNWGEYMDPSLLEEFETLHNVKVVMDEVGSSEDMYQKISSGTTKYDVAIPGDYIIEKMHKENLLKEIDVKKKDKDGNLIMTNYKENMFHDDLEFLRSTQSFEGNQKYAMPYFWGAYAIIYSTKKAEVENVIKQNGLNVFFDRSLFNTKVNIGMYDIPRWVVTAYLLNNHLDVNTTDLKTFETQFVNQVSKVRYDLWGNDILKKQVGNGNLDFAFVQLGDFFDQYYLKQSSFEEIDFNCFIPEYTSAFYDGLIIPKTCENYDLALEFINFFLDPEKAYENASYVGYSPAIKETIEIIRNDEDFADIVTNYPFYLDPIKNKTAFLFRDLEGSYASEVIELVNRAKNR